MGTFYRDLPLCSINKTTGNSLSGKRTGGPPQETAMKGSSAVLW